MQTYNNGNGNGNNDNANLLDKYKQKRKIAVVCASNQNRSMAAHYLLKQLNFNVSSFGTGSHVKLPGPSIDKPNVYEFGTPYDEMYADLKAKDSRLYTQNGILQMLDRNRQVKRAPERFQDSRQYFNLIFTFEERVFDNIIEELQLREPFEYKPIYVVNMTTKDNHEEAERGAQLCAKFCSMIVANKNWENEISKIVEKFEEETGRRLLHTVLFT